MKNVFFVYLPIVKWRTTCGGSILCVGKTSVSHETLVFVRVHVFFWNWDKMEFICTLPFWILVCTMLQVERRFVQDETQAFFNSVAMKLFYVDVLNKKERGVTGIALKSLRYVLNSLAQSNSVDLAMR